MGVYLQKICVIPVFVCLLLVFLCLPSVYADRGMIPVKPAVSVYEPGQKAILAWNGTEEIMILSTDVTSSQETLVVEILPLPSKPIVEAASFQSFEEIQRLIWGKGVNTYQYETYDQARSGSVEIVFHEKIGAHNITVVKASDTSELLAWMEDFLNNNGVDSGISLGNFESVIEEYMNRGFRYYVLDLITVTAKEKSLNPILYRFRSYFLYYPLIITSPVSGTTEIILFTITEGKVTEDYSPFQKVKYKFGYASSVHAIELVLAKGELSKIDLRIGELFQSEAWLTVLKYSGEASWLNKDLMISTLGVTPSEPIIPNQVTNDYTIVSRVIGFLLILLGGTVILAGTAAVRYRPRTRTRFLENGSI
jgi:hypothetical protein